MAWTVEWMITERCWSWSGTDGAPTTIYSISPIRLVVKPRNANIGINFYSSVIHAPGPAHGLEIRILLLKQCSLKQNDSCMGGYKDRRIEGYGGRRVREKDKGRKIKG